MHKCRVCNTESDKIKVVAKEMMYDNAGSFEYFECPHCNCLQIVNVPENLNDFYGERYYSYTTPTDTKTKGTAPDSKRVLDVGCGAGAMLCNMAANGVQNPVGCDPFISADIAYENGVKIYKKSIHEMEGQFDIIMLNDSFEHMSDPHEVFESLKRLLAPKGVVRMTLPMYPNLAFDTYQENWYQLDAPRHIILHSLRSLSILAEKHGLKIARCTFDSNDSSLLRSFFYKKGVTFFKQDPKEVFKYFTKTELIEMNKKISLANQKAHGDHATLFFAHK